MKNIAIATLISLIVLTGGCSKEKTVSNDSTKVTAYLFTNQYMSPTHDVEVTVPLRATAVDSALILVYYYDVSVGGWYSSPGPGAGASYQTRYFMSSTADSTTFTLRAYSPTFGAYNGGNITIPKLKIIIAVASDLYSGKKEPVDYNDYKATMRYYHLPE